MAGQGAGRREGQGGRGAPLRYTGRTNRHDPLLPRVLSAPARDLGEKFVDSEGDATASGRGFTPMVGCQRNTSGMVYLSLVFLEPFWGTGRRLGSGPGTVCLYSIVEDRSIFCKVKMAREKKRYTGGTFARSSRSKRAIEPVPALVSLADRRAQHPSGRRRSRGPAIACFTIACFTVPAPLRPALLRAPRFPSCRSTGVLRSRHSRPAPGPDALSRLA